MLREVSRGASRNTVPIQPDVSNHRTQSYKLCLKATIQIAVTVVRAIRKIKQMMAAYPSKDREQEQTL